MAYFLIQPRRLGNAIVGVTSLIVEGRASGDLRANCSERCRWAGGPLSSGIVHDFNNLLSVVLGLTDLDRANLPTDHLTQPDLLRIREGGRASGGPGQAVAHLQQEGVRRAGGSR